MHLYLQLATTPLEALGLLVGGYELEILNINKEKKKKEGIFFLKRFLLGWWWNPPPK